MQTKFKLEVLLICAAERFDTRVPGSVSDEPLPRALARLVRFSERFETRPGLYSGG
jgi:hypothetical protein